MLRATGINAGTSRGVEYLLTLGVDKNAQAVADKFRAIAAGAFKGVDDASTQSVARRSAGEKEHTTVVHDEVRKREAAVLASQRTIDTHFVKTSIQQTQAVERLRHVADGFKGATDAAAKFGLVNEQNAAKVSASIDHAMSKVDELHSAVSSIGTLVNTAASGATLAKHAAKAFGWARGALTALGGTTAAGVATTATLAAGAGYLGYKAGRFGQDYFNAGESLFNAAGPQDMARENYLRELRQRQVEHMDARTAMMQSRIGATSAFLGDLGLEHGIRGEVMAARAAVGKHGDAQTIAMLEARANAHASVLEHITGREREAKPHGIAVEMDQLEKARLREVESIRKIEFEIGTIKVDSAKKELDLTKATARAAAMKAGTSEDRLHTIKRTFSMMDDSDQKDVGIALKMAEHGNFANMPAHLRTLIADVRPDLAEGAEAFERQRQQNHGIGSVLANAESQALADRTAADKAHEDEVRAGKTLHSAESEEAALGDKLAEAQAQAIEALAPVLIEAIKNGTTSGIEKLLSSIHAEGFSAAVESSRSMNTM